MKVSTVSTLWVGCGCAFAGAGLTGRVTDPQNKAVAGATIRLAGSWTSQICTDQQGLYAFPDVPPNCYELAVEALGFEAIHRPVSFTGQHSEVLDFQFSLVSARTDSVVITSMALQPAIDLRDTEVFNRALITRDDQILQQLNSGIDAGPHEGGGKSLEIRRFGFGLDHGGVNAGLKVLVDDVQQNQGSQAHGQGYLGSLKALNPELIQDVTIINGIFSAEYGDFSCLGVVHIRQRESLPEQYTIRLQSGSSKNRRGFLAYSPDVQKVDAYMAYDGSYVDGPFQNRGRYRRDNANGNYTRDLNSDQKLGFRLLFGRNNFYSSGQLPLDLVNAGQLSNEQVYIPDDGSYEFKGRSRGYGFEAKTSFQITRNISLNGGLTKVANAFFQGSRPRVYVDSAPRFVASAALTVSQWRGWGGFFRMRAVNHYRLDGSDPGIVASGHTVFDLGVAKQVRRRMELNLSMDNVTDRSYYETQNFFASRITPVSPVIARMHATPSYPLTLVAGVTFRIHGK